MNEYQRDTQALAIFKVINFCFSKDFSTKQHSTNLTFCSLYFPLIIDFVLQCKTRWLNIKETCYHLVENVRSAYTQLLKNRYRANHMDALITQLRKGFVCRMNNQSVSLLKATPHNLWRL